MLGAAVLATVRADDGFEQRARAMREAVAADFDAKPGKLSAKNAFWRAGAMFELGRIEEGRRLVARGLDQLEPGNRENRWIYGGNTGFIAWPGLDCLIVHGRHMDDALKARYRRIYTGGAFYQKLSTSNHKIMAAVSRYLATSLWGADAFKPDPFYLSPAVKATHQGFTPEKAMRFDAADPTGEKYIRTNLAEILRGGPGEYASRPYGSENLLPVLTIAECAPDPELRRMAAEAYGHCLAQFAPAWLRGHLATFSPRSYPDMETQQPWGVAALAWVYFGGVSPDRLHEQWALRAATSKFRVPTEVHLAANDRSEPYIYRALINRWALYHFVNRDYVLFSRSPKAAKNPFQGQSYPCGVMWEEPDVSKGSHLWITNPAADDNAVPGNQASGLHTHGVTKHEQEVQHRDALLFVFRIPPDFRNPYALGFIPGGHLASSRAEDAIFLHYGPVMVAIRSAHPIEWDPQAAIKAPSSKPRPGDSEFRVRRLNTALAMETAPVGEFPGATPQARLAAFRARIESRSRLVFSENPTSSAVYTDRSGNRLECVYDGPESINGQAVDHARWPVHDSPWFVQETPDSPLVVRPLPGRQR